MASKYPSSSDMVDGCRLYWPLSLILFKNITISGPKSRALLICSLVIALENQATMSAATTGILEVRKY